MNHSTPTHNNHLVGASSPYLLQHAHNPVDWYPWDEEALKLAKAENKLIIISIGYAACHWCHVMERESFEDTTVAGVMNKDFVSIKVDREERPDIDQIYMDAVMLMNRQGGWPLNVVTLPDGRPIFGGTYFPKENWISILNQLSELWEKQPERAFEFASQLESGLKSLDEIVINEEEVVFTESYPQAMLEKWSESFDYKEGGPNRAPKFPMPNNYQFLLRYAHFTEDQELADYVKLTLRKMAFGGMYDQLGGGFARYSTDGLWKVPHFEKMLYDNGQLVSLYSEAWTKDPQNLYEETVCQTLEFVARELTSPEGGFYSSLDADSEGEEGKFYIWDKSEIESRLGEDAAWFIEYYQVTDSGNWHEEHTNVLITRSTPEEFAASKGMPAADFKAKLEAAKAKLMDVRSKRIRPGLDDKILTSWNALMLKGYVDAYRAFGKPQFLETALRNARFIEEKLLDGDRLNRNYKAGKATINAFLDDYALLIQAWISLYEATHDQHWLDQAQALTEYAITHFFDKEKHMFWYTSDEDEALITRKYETSDNVIPASNSVMADNLFQLAHFYDRAEWKHMASQMLKNVMGTMAKFPSGYSNWGILMLKNIYPFYEVVITGDKAASLAREMDQHYHPNKILIAATNDDQGKLPLLEHRFIEGTSKIFVCQNKVCHLPVEAAATAISQMK